MIFYRTHIYMLEALSISNLTKTYANNMQALSSVNLSIKQGDFFALLGSNGAGKTTMIGIICSLLNKSSGEVRVLGKDQSKHNARAKSSAVPSEIPYGRAGAHRMAGLTSRPWLLRSPTRTRERWRRVDGGCRMADRRTD